MFAVENILGPQEQSYVGYATDPSVRKDAASGGGVGAICRYLLDEGIVSGVLASEIEVQDGELNARPRIARTTEELARCRNSIYLDFNLGAKGIYRQVIEELKTTGNRLAIVGLFCHLTHLVQLLERNGIARDRVILIGLFCSHAPFRTLANQVLARQSDRLDEMADYITKSGDGGRDGRLHGGSTIVYKDGSRQEFRFIEFTTFKNAWFYTPKKCLVCPDQFAEIADISCGDAWYSQIRRHRYKWTTIVTRNPEADAIVRAMAQRRLLELRYVDPASIVSSQRRVAGVEKAALAARVKLAPLFGMKLPPAAGKIRLRDLAHSLLMLSAVRISQNERAMRVIMRMPTPVVLLFTLTVKVFEEALLAGMGRGKGVGGLVTGPAAAPRPGPVQEAAASPEAPGHDEQVRRHGT
ncbi:MAG: Coenzyme F420 hydrogenase/dehydrogenase, beta subunit C-terminal domain [Roseicyclus sp.]